VSEHKAQFQINTGDGWKTVAEADIIDGIIKPPSTWTAVRAMQKRIVYTGSLPVEVTVAPSTNEPTPRETHFAGFAKTVIKEMYSLVTSIHDFEDMQEDFAEVIARRAYDLAIHIISTTMGQVNHLKRSLKGL
jgi:hypothetical protein